MNQPIEKKVDLKIDFREKRSGILEEIEKHNNHLTVEMADSLFAILHEPF